MKKTTTTRKPNRRPARERKNPSGVQNQLSARRPNTGSRKRAEKPNMNTTLEQPITETAEPATVEASKKPEAEFTRGPTWKSQARLCEGQPARRERRGPEEVVSRDERGRC